jgi:translation initiation factor eIF-2B subunit delta
MLAEKIDMYIKERVTLADEVIVAFGKEKIKDGSVVLTYARCVMALSVLTFSKDR